MLSQAALGSVSDIEDGLSPVLHSSGRAQFIRLGIIPPQDQGRRILNKSRCWGENARVRAKVCVCLFAGDTKVSVCVCLKRMTLTSGLYLFVWTPFTDGLFCGTWLASCL